MSDGFTRTSLTTTGGPGRAPNRAMLRGVGFTDEDFDKPVIGVASLFSDITPCNAHRDRLAEKGREGVRAAGGVPQTFGAPTVSDGISMGHKVMRYSLVSREVIADSLETVCGAIGSCTLGVGPPSGKKALRISAARWNCRSVSTDSSLPSRVSPCQSQAWPLMSVIGDK